MLSVLRELLLKDVGQVLCIGRIVTDAVILMCRKLIAILHQYRDHLTVLQNKNRN